MAAIEPPADYRELLQPLPEGVRFCAPSDKPHLIHYFCTERVRLGRELPRLRKTMREDAMLWVSWPKKSSLLPTTVTEDVVREVALPLGLVDNKICAVDETWSAVRLVVRLVNRRAGAAPPP